MISRLILLKFLILHPVLDDILNINNIYFDNMVRKVYPAELQVNKANTSDTYSKKSGKDKESIQSSTTPDPGYHMEK